MGDSEREFRIEEANIPVHQVVFREGFQILVEIGLNGAVHFFVVGACLSVGLHNSTHLSEREGSDLSSYLALHEKHEFFSLLSTVHKVLEYDIEIGRSH